MKIHPRRAEDGAGCGREDGRGGFEKQEGRLGAGVVELFDVVAWELCISAAEREEEEGWGENVRIVTADADNLAGGRFDGSHGV